MKRIGASGFCAAWGMARSSFYAMTSGQHAEQPPAKRRGPKPAISDEALDWARLRVCRDIRVARKRVLRLMRENNLLSPHRCRRRGGNPHDGEHHSCHVGHRWRSGVHGGRRLGLDLHRRRALERRVRLGPSTASPPCSRLPVSGTGIILSQCRRFCNRPWARSSRCLFRRIVPANLCKGMRMPAASTLPQRGIDRIRAGVVSPRARAKPPRNKSAR